MDRLSEYVINYSSCNMPRCEYVENGIEIDCDKCQEIMIAEHDKQIRAEAIDKFAKWLDEKGYLTHIEYDEDEDFEGNIIWSETEASLNADDVVVEYLEQLKEQK